MQAAPCFVFEPFRLDVPDQRLWRGSTVVPVPPKPFALLCCLVARAGRLVTKEALLQAVWPEVVVQEDVITVAIGQLRQIWAIGRAPRGLSRRCTGGAIGSSPRSWQPRHPRRASGLRRHSSSPSPRRGSSLGVRPPWPGCNSGGRQSSRVSASSA